MKTRTSTLVALALLSLAPVALVGCSTPGYKKGDSAADTMRTADQAAMALLTSAQNAQTYFLSLQQGELKPMFARFEKEVDTYDSNAKRLTGAVADVRSNTNAYIATLRKTGEGLSNPSLKSANQARIDEITKQLSDIDGRAGTADKAAAEVSKDLGDLRNFLRADLSPRAITNAAPMLNTLDLGISKLGAAIEALRKDLADVQNAIASGT